MNNKIYLTEEAKLKARVQYLEAELEYHEKKCLSGEGHRCEECGRIRETDDCVIIDNGYRYYACSEECAREIEGQIERDVADEAHIDWCYRNR